MSGPASHKPDFAALQSRLGHAFADASLLRAALTHPSLASARGKAARAPSPYERLEFLGDRVVGLAVAEMLWRRFPDEPEGDLSRRFTALVCQETIAEIALELGLDREILLCEGTAKENGRANPSILSDACEAVLGAVFADAGFDAARAIAERLWGERIARVSRPPRDAKTALQEWAQGRGLPLPAYTVMDRTGPSHAPIFRIRVAVAETGEAEGEGTSKRIAEQAAATVLLDLIADMNT
ncbi:MAG: ribonuclease III [Rhodospirillaceae bacterium]